MKLMPPPPAWAQWLLLCAILPVAMPISVGIFERSDLVSSARCDCHGNSIVGSRYLKYLTLLQSDAEAERPRDCTCVNGLKTSATTPRDELLGMGPVALGRHLDSCLRKVDGLAKQKEYAVAESEVRIREAEKQKAEAKQLLDNMKNKTATDHTDALAEKKQLLQNVDTLEKEIASLNSKYNELYSAWWTMKKTMTETLANTKKCKCPQLKVMFLQNLRGGFHNEHVLSGPDQDYMYDTAHKVEECETKVNELSDDIEDAQKEGRNAMIASLEHKEVFGKRVADQEHLTKLLDQTPQLLKLGKAKRELDRMLKARKEKVAKQEKSNVNIKSGLEQLNAEMKACACAA
jgi:hypothetical protein